MKFYKVILKPVKDPIKEAYGDSAATTVEEHMGDKDARCPECGHNHWWFWPKESATVRVGGKPYIQCIECSYVTHL
jgi:DNA-directed RNA polymerase subunit RPC12/RpoP